MATNSGRNQVLTKQVAHKVGRIGRKLAAAETALSLSIDMDMMDMGALADSVAPSTTIEVYFNNNPLPAFTVPARQPIAIKIFSDASPHTCAINSGASKLVTFNVSANAKPFTGSFTFPKSGDYTLQGTLPGNALPNNWRISVQ